MSLLIMNIMISLEDLTDYIWYLLDNHTVHITKVAEKILQYDNNIILFILYTDILLHLYPVYIVDVVTVSITELSQWSK